jgi:lysophospholipase L1-like esterase
LTSETALSDGDARPRDVADRIGPRIAILGDSWIAALGCKRTQSFGRVAARLLDASAVLDVSVAGQSVQATIDKRLDEVRDFSPDLTIAAIGGTEALVHPRAGVQRAIERFAPNQWHGVAGLDPRVKYVSKGKQLRSQRREQRIKVAVKRVILATIGGAPRTPPAIFERAARELLSRIGESGRPIMLVGLPVVDERLFPGTNASVDTTNRILERLGDELPNVLYTRVTTLTQWSDYLDDHLHLSAAGHTKVADMLAAVARDLLLATPSGAEGAQSSGSS